MSTAASAQPRRGKSATAPAPSKDQSGERAPTKTPSTPATRTPDEDASKSPPQSARDAETAAPAAPNVDADLGAPPAPSEETGPRVSPLTPAPDEFSKGPPAAAPAELDRLLADIAALRSRVSALTTTLFKSKLRVVLETRGDDARIENLTVTLDDGVVFQAPPRFSAEDERVLYEHALAPGQHVLGVEVERYDARNRQYRTWQTSKFAIVVPESRVLETIFSVSDDSNMAVDFPDDLDGRYDLRVRLRARVSDQ